LRSNDLVILFDKCDTVRSGNDLIGDFIHKYDSFELVKTPSWRSCKVTLNYIPGNLHFIQVISENGRLTKIKHPALQNPAESSISLMRISRNDSANASRYLSICCGVVTKRLD
jgi:hypothetical protein